MGIMPIGFFAPLPLAIMIPFMAAQSFAMGHAFGTSFQYGKRKISSMTNEEFNALSATDLHGQLQADIRAMIPNMNQSFQVMEQFQIDIINSMVNTLKLAGQQFFEWITTGKTGTETSFQTDTSATSFVTGEAGAPPIIDIQGGDRSNLNQGNDRFLNEAGQTYDEWLAFNNTNEVIDQKQIIAAKAKKELTRLAILANAANLRTTTTNLRVGTDPLTSRGNLKRGQLSKAPSLADNRKAEKLRLLTNVRNIQNAMNQVKRNLTVQLQYAKTRMRPGTRGAYATLMATNAERALKKLSFDLLRAKRLLANYK